MSNVSPQSEVPLNRERMTDTTYRPPKPNVADTTAPPPRRRNHTERSTVTDPVSCRRNLDPAVNIVLASLFSPTITQGESNILFTGLCTRWSVPDMIEPWFNPSF
jgi:hypothetical protein